MKASSRAVAPEEPSPFPVRKNARNNTMPSTIPPKYGWTYGLGELIFFAGAVVVISFSMIPLSLRERGKGRGLFSNRYSLLAFPYFFLIMHFHFFITGDHTAYRFERSRAGGGQIHMADDEGREDPGN